MRHFNNHFCLFPFSLNDSRLVLLSLRFLSSLIALVFFSPALLHQLFSISLLPSWSRVWLRAKNHSLWEVFGWTKGKKAFYFE